MAPRPRSSHARRRISAVEHPLPPALQFLRLLWAVVHALEKASKRMQSDLGVTGPQRLALRVLQMHPGVSAREVARILHVHPSTLTGVLQRLIARRADPRDGRRAVLRLTAAGAAVVADNSGTAELAVQAVLRRTSKQSRASAQRLLVLMAEELERGA